MKRLFMLVLITLLAACSGGTAPSAPPSDAVSAFMAYFVAGEYDAAQALISSSFSLDEIEDEFRDIFKNLTYDITSENISGDRAYIALSIKTVDFAAIMEDVMDDAFYLVFTDITVEELSSRVESMFVEKATAYDAPIADREVTVVLELNDNGWMIVADDTFIDALMGGVISFAEYARGW